MMGKRFFVGTLLLTTISGAADLQGAPVATVFDREIDRADLQIDEEQGNPAQRLAILVEQATLQALITKFDIDTSAAAIEQYLLKQHPWALSEESLAAEREQIATVLPPLKRVVYDGQSPDQAYEQDLEGKLERDQWLLLAQQFGSEAAIDQLETMLTREDPELIADRLEATRPVYVLTAAKQHICALDAVSAAVENELDTSPLLMDDDAETAALREGMRVYQCEVAARTWLRGFIAENVVVLDAAFGGYEDYLNITRPLGPPDRAHEYDDSY